jgi:NAD(P)-dependent dehydrogenase (short-subunit alcohol dehydrogenase family)
MNITSVVSAGTQATPLRGKSALVIGASSGVGRATVNALIAEGARVAAVARGGEALEALRGQAAEPINTIQADAADPEAVQRLLRQLQPELIVLAAGVRPRMASLDEQTWESFSEIWNADTRAAFYLVKTALTTPLAPGSTVAIVSSGAAINGSPLSGGYAGAKRMQWLLADYAQQISERRKLGIRFFAVLPTQLIEGTAIGTAAAEVYGALRGISGAEHLKRNWPTPLDADKVAAAIVGCLRGDVAQGVTAIEVNGQGTEPLD